MVAAVDRVRRRALLAALWPPEPASRLAIRPRAYKGRPLARLLEREHPQRRGQRARLGRGDLADQLICDHALFHLEADLRWLELTAARLDKLREAVIR